MIANQPATDAAGEGGAFARFSLLGGPMHDMAARAAPRIGAAAFGAGLSVVMWLLLALLSTFEGHAEQFFSLQAMAIHGRMLVAVPLIFFCETQFDRGVRVACGALIGTGVVAGPAKTALEKTAGRLVWLNNAPWVQVGLLTAVVIFSVSMPREYLPGVSSYAEDPAAASESLAGYWYWLVCLPAFRFVMARFFWMIGLWAFLVWRLSRQDLKLEASHPDRLGGLGLLEAAQSKLGVLVVALGVIDAAALAETFQKVEASTTLAQVHIFLVALFGIVLVCGPLLPLVSPLYDCRHAGVVEFSAVAREYSARFRRRWIGPDAPDYSELLGAADIQSLADLASGYENVRSMRILPLTTSQLLTLFFCAAVPHAPLLLLKYPLTELIANLVQTIIGT